MDENFIKNVFQTVSHQIRRAGWTKTSLRTSSQTTTLEDEGLDGRKFH
jgi:hypothetical protein